jgi:hypothetical protein
VSCKLRGIEPHPLGIVLHDFRDRLRGQASAHRAPALDGAEDWPRKYLDSCNGAGTEANAALSVILSRRSRGLPIAYVPRLLRAPLQNIFKFNSCAVGAGDVVNCAEVLPQPARAFERGIAALVDSHGCFAVFIGEMHDPHVAFTFHQIVDGICQATIITEGVGANRSTYLGDRVRRR